MADRFVYDPADPTPTVGGPMLQPPSKQHDNRAIEARDDVLVFTGPPLDADVDLLGEVGAVVYLRTDSGLGDVFVRLCDVDPDGRSLNITDGMHRLRPGSEAEAPDGTVVVRVSLSPDRVPGPRRPPAARPGGRGGVPALRPPPRHRGADRVRDDRAPDLLRGPARQRPPVARGAALPPLSGGPSTVVGRAGVTVRK